MAVRAMLTYATTRSLVASSSVPSRVAAERQIQERRGAAQPEPAALDGDGHLAESRPLVGIAVAPERPQLGARHVEQGLGAAKLDGGEADRAGAEPRLALVVARRSDQRAPRPISTPVKSTLKLAEPYMPIGRHQDGSVLRADPVHRDEAHLPAAVRQPPGTMARATTPAPDANVLAPDSRYRPPPIGSMVTPSARLGVPDAEQQPPVAGIRGGALQSGRACRTWRSAAGR